MKIQIIKDYSPTAGKDVYFVQKEGFTVSAHMELKDAQKVFSDLVERLESQTKPTVLAEYEVK